ncbi:hypothetical protein ABIC83_002942 [Roseateles asaccharophilus]|uniref:hypothetical protein n=1 Tax=Roseateles asaccharophilus TaxID=582607 RepID=UPI0038344799
MPTETTHPRVATADIHLVKADGRKRWGLEVVGTITAGTRFVFTPGEVGSGAGAGFVDLGETPSGGSISGLVGADIVAEILAKSVEKTDDCFADVACRHGLGRGAAAEVLDRLIAHGLVQISDVREAVGGLFGPEGE